MQPSTLPPLRVVRRAKGLTLRGVAQKARIDPGQLSRIELGKQQPTLDVLYRLAVALELRELRDMLALYLPDPGRAA